MFPHVITGELRISQINVSWEADPNGIASTTVKFGIIASTSPSGALADINYFDRIDFSTDDKTYQQVTLNYAPSLMKLGLNGATTTSFLTNDTLSSSSLFATTTAYYSPLGAYKTYPGVGDLIMSITKQNSGIPTTSPNIIVKVFYHVK